MRMFSRSRSSWSSLNEEQTRKLSPKACIVVMRLYYSRKASGRLSQCSLQKRCAIMPLFRSGFLSCWYMGIISIMPNSDRSTKSFLTYPFQAPRLESPSKLASCTNLRAEEEYEIDQGAKSQGNKADGCHGPGSAHVGKHKDTEMCQGSCHDEGGD